MRIGLIFPNKDRRYKTVHLGLAALAAYVRRYHKDVSFSVLDTRVATRKETSSFFKCKFDLIGITVYSPVYEEVKEIFYNVKSHFKETPVCLGGPYVTTIMEEIFEETPADFAVYGEGEEPFEELIRSMKNRTSVSIIRGLMYRDINGKIIRNPARDRIKDLDTLPLPAYDLFPMDRYPLHRLVTSRGCPYSCSWCNSTSIWHHGIRFMSAERMVLEVEYLLDNYGKKILVFGDNTFNANPARIMTFCDLLIKKNIQVLWSASIRADLMTRDLAMKMKEAGCYNVSIGVESANNEMLKKMGKNTTIEEIAKGVGFIKEAGIEIMSQYVIGSPYETLETVKETVEWAKKSGCDFKNFYTVLPFKGTPQWEYVKQHGKLYTDKIHLFHSINPRIVFETPEFPYGDRLEAIRLVKNEGFYSNKDTKNPWFDFAKGASRKLQELLPGSKGRKVYAFLKSVYRMKLIKKHNI